MSGTFPTSPGPKDIKLINDQPILSSRAQSGKSQRRIVAGHLWRIKVSYAPMIRNDIAPLYAFSAKQRGDSFQITVPDKVVPLGVATGTPLVNGAHAAGVLSIATKGWTASTTGILKAGDIKKFANHTKVYMVAEDADSDATGNATIVLINPTVEALADNEAVTVNDVPFTVAFDDEIFEWKTNDAKLSGYSSDLIEAL